MSHTESYAKTFFGFWLYLLTDCILFGAFLITYVVLQPNTAAGPSAKDLFRLSHALLETLFLLTSSLFAGLARGEAIRERRGGTVGLYLVAFSFGVLFLAMSYMESASLVARGVSWQTSGFLSAFFTVIWVHALHIVGGLVWILVLLFQIGSRGITPITFHRLSSLTLFWQFLALIWIFTFTIVYLLGVANL